MSSSDYSTSSSDKRLPNYIHLPSESAEDTLQTPTANDQSRTFWTYFKWFVWTAISGLFDCGSAVSELSLTRYWPVVSNDRVAFRPPENVSGKQLACEKFDSELEEVFFRPTELTPTHSLKTADENFFLLETVQHIISKIPEETIQQDITPSIVCELIETVNPSTAHSQVTKLRQVWPPVAKDVTVVTKDKSPSPKPCTLLASVYAESKNGLIDDAARDLIVKDLLNSVIPRNLSNSSDITVTPAIRKMYAWTNPNSLHRCDEEGTTDQRKRPDSFDLVSNSSASDNRLAYPGKLTMSDSSFSPQSPGTGESSTPAGEDPPRTDAYGDLFLPDIDKQDHTLAWAISNLKMCDDKDGSSIIGKHFPETPPSPRILADRPPLPLGGSSRQSRDKSPVCTINSARLTDTMSLPTIMPFEGEQLFASSSSSHEHRSHEIPKPKRSSSLKSHRTPPGTPSTPKAVRFADAFGLDLATVRHVFDQEAPPKIPASATFDLHLDTDESIAKIGAKQFGLCFAQPGTASNFIRRVLSQTVCLEDAHVDMPRGVLTGTIRVKSLGFEKHIYVRITYNNWATFFDVQASYVQGSHDGATDRFSFSVVFPDTMVPGDRAQFAIRYDAHTGQQFWDNNHGQNYSVTCYAKATDLAGDGSWVHYL